MNRNICRVCLKKGILSTIFSDDKCAPYFMMMECTSVKITKEDTLPSLICQDCLNNLKIAFQFKRQCEASDYQLRKTFVNMNNPQERMVGNQNDEIVNKFTPIQKETKVTASLNLICDTKICESEVDLDNRKTKSEVIVSNDEQKPPDIVDKDLSQKKIGSPKKKILKVQKTNPKKLKVPEKCLECGKTFNYTGYLEAHMRIHSGEKPYICKVCDKAFTQMGNLVLHMRTHSGEKPFQCEICSKQFCTSSNLKVHRKTHLQDRSYECPQCLKLFKSLKLLESHVGTHTGVKNHVCKLCGKCFYKTSYLTTHINTVHVGEKKFKCIQCGKEFSNSSNLTAHVRIHTGEKPFVCDLCDARFNQSSSLQRHKKHHDKIESKKNAKKHKSADISKHNYPSSTSNNYNQMIPSIESNYNQKTLAEYKQQCLSFNLTKPHTDTLSQYLKASEMGRINNKKNPFIID